VSVPAVLLEHEVTLAAKPLVHADSTIRALRPVVRDDEDGGVVVGEAE
jgi:hypothetical protein